MRIRLKKPATEYDGEYLSFLALIRDEEKYEATAFITIEYDDGHEHMVGLPFKIGLTARQLVDTKGILRREFQILQFQCEPNYVEDALKDLFDAKSAKIPATFVYDDKEIAMPVVLILDFDKTRFFIDVCDEQNIVTITGDNKMIKMIQDGKGADYNVMIRGTDYGEGLLSKDKR